MIEEIKEIKEVTEVKETVTGRVMKCDVCGKIIFDSRNDKKGQFWWHLYTGHNDWGNDSCESMESFDVCSTECLHKKLDEYITTSNYGDGLNSQYINVEHEWR